MPRTLPAQIVLEKNRLSSENPFLLLLDIRLPDNTMLRVCHNNEEIVWQGNTYIACNVQMDPVTEDVRSSIPQVTLRVSNIAHTLEPYLQIKRGLVRSRVTLHIVNAAYLDADTSDLDLEMAVQMTAVDARWATFTLAPPSPLRKRFPLYYTSSVSCNWQFKSAECKYINGQAGDAALDVVCDRTLNGDQGCRAHQNTANFGGHPGLASGGLKIV